MNILLNIVVGIIPEILYFFFFCISIFQLKNKKIFLLLYTIIVYLICIIVKKYELLYYILFIVLLYVGLKIIYKGKMHISDLFIIAFGFAYLVTAYNISYLISNGTYERYYMAIGVSRVLLFLPFIFYKSLNSIYRKYQVLWDKPQKQEKRILKSITLRNICLISLFTFILILYVLVIGIINSFK